MARVAYMHGEMIYINNLLYVSTDIWIDMI